MWLLDFLPSWLFYLTLFAGIVSILLSQFARIIPFFFTYRLILLVGGILLSLIGVFFIGASFNEDRWRLRVADAEKRALETQVSSANANIQIQAKGSEKVKVIRDVQIVVQKEIVEQSTKIDASCKVPTEAIKLHNKAATTPEGVK